MSDIIDFVAKKKEREQAKFARLDLVELDDGSISVCVYGIVNGKATLVYSDVGEHPLETPINAIIQMEQSGYHVVDDEIFAKQLSLKS